MADISKILLPDNTEYDIKDAKARMVVLSYGSSTWEDFIAAYNDNRIVYCATSSNSNPAVGDQTRRAFMAYVNLTANPQSVEFQYLRSLSNHTESSQMDEIYVYTLKSNNTWSVATRKVSPKIIAGTNMTSTFVSGTTPTITLNATDTTYSLGTSGDNIVLTPSSGAAQSITAPVAKKLKDTNEFDDLGYVESDLSDSTNPKITMGLDSNVVGYVEVSTTTASSQSNIKLFATDTTTITSDLIVDDDAHIKGALNTDGNYSMNKSQPQILLNNTAIDWTTTNNVTSQAVTGLWCRAKDAGNSTSVFETIADTNGDIRTRIATQNCNTSKTITGSNYLDLKVTKAGVSSVSVSAPEAWRTALSAQEEEAGGALASGTDLNNLIDTKNYWVPNSGITNVPVASRYGYLEVVKTGQGSYLQRFTVYGNNTTADRGTTQIRYYTNSQWYNWIELIPFDDNTSFTFNSWHNLFNFRTDTSYIYIYVPGFQAKGKTNNTSFTASGTVTCQALILGSGTTGGNITIKQVVARKWGTEFYGTYTSSFGSSGGAAVFNGTVTIS